MDLDNTSNNGIVAIRHISPRWHDNNRTAFVFEDFHGIVEVQYPKDEPTLGYIWDLWVDEGFRGEGRATQLLKAAEEHIALQGCIKAVLDWDKRDSPLWVFQWYERHGYHETEFGRYQSRLEKRLTP